MWWRISVNVASFGVTIFDFYQWATGPERAQAVMLGLCLFQLTWTVLNTVSLTALMFEVPHATR